jgi:hypothetical protein
MIATEPLTGEQLGPIGWSGQQGLEDARNLIHYYRITPDHRIVMGGGPVGLGPGADLDHDRDERAWAHVEQHVRWLWPHLSDVAVTHRRGGPFSVTMDLAPALGYVGEDRTAVYGLGCIGHGVSMSYLNGHVLADLVAGGGTDAVTQQCPFVNRRVVCWPREPAATAAKYAIRAYLQAEDAFNERLLARAPAAGTPEQPPVAVPHQRRRAGLSVPAGMRPAAAPPGPESPRSRGAGTGEPGRCSCPLGRAPPCMQVVRETLRSAGGARSSTVPSAHPVAKAFGPLIYDVCVDDQDMLLTGSDWPL